MRSSGIAVLGEKDAHQPRGLPELHDRLLHDDDHGPGHAERRQAEVVQHMRAVHDDPAIPLRHHSHERGEAIRIEVLGKQGCLGRRAHQVQSAPVLRHVAGQRMLVEEFHFGERGRQPAFRSQVEEIRQRRRS